MFDSLLIWQITSSVLLTLAIVQLRSGGVNSIPIDNGVDGEPEVECGAEGIEITFRTRNPFNGRLYVKGRYNDGGCQNEQIGRLFTGITLSFGTCNVQRLRSLNPRGIFASVTVVISFHPLFVTKVDRVYKVQCFYMEAEKSVSNQIDVSDITTVFATHLVPMPICRYEVLDGGPAGTPIQFAVVGQQVYHKWTCDSEITDTFCMLIHSCVVDDGRNDTVMMINEQGCALDRFVLNNLEYPTDLMAGQEAHVFKYADRSMLFFQCKISISVKEGGECPRPQCAEPTRFKRHIASRHREFDEALTLDVSSQQIDTLDVSSMRIDPLEREISSLMSKDCLRINHFVIISTTCGCLTSVLVLLFIFVYRKASLS